MYRSYVQKCITLLSKWLAGSEFCQAGQCSAVIGGTTFEMIIASHLKTLAHTHRGESIGIVANILASAFMSIPASIVLNSLRRTCDVSFPVRPERKTKLVAAFLHNLEEKMSFATDTNNM